MLTALLGWFGTLLCLVCHALLSFEKLERGRPYFSANALAALCVCVSSYLLVSWQAVVMNGFWLIVSVAGWFGLTIGFARLASLRSLLVLCAALAAAAGYLAIGSAEQGIRLLGWAATLLYCGGYALLAVERLSQRHFLACNVVAAMALIPVLVLDQNWPVVGLESAWGTLSLIGLGRMRVGD